MKFYNRLFPQGYVIVGNSVVKFNDGIYETIDEAEIQNLKKLDYIDYEDKYTEELNRVIDDVIMPTQSKSEDKQEFKIPVRWTMDKIREFANEKNIEIPEGMSKKNAIEFVQSKL